MPFNGMIRFFLILTIAALLGAIACRTTSEPSDTDQQPTQQPLPDQVAALRAEVIRLRSLLPDQAHAMADVSYHFSNLWFAARAGNWPLVEFYFLQTHLHLRWAIRIMPFRQIETGQYIPLAEVLMAIEAGNLKTLGQTIAAKDPAKFEPAYREMLDSCYACHLAAERPFLRLRIPEKPGSPLINFTPPKEESP